MKLQLVRIDLNDRGLFGHLTIEGTNFSCVTLERHDIAIPIGTYKIKLYDSPRWGYKVPLLLDVPNRDFIEIHCGNWEKDSIGCILVGTQREGDAIDNSHTAFTTLMTFLVKANDISIEIK